MNLKLDATFDVCIDRLDEQLALSWKVLGVVLILNNILYSIF